MRQEMSARVIPDRGADHGGGQVPLAQQAGNDGSIVKDKFADLLHQRAGVMLRELLDHHDGHRGEHAKTNVERVMKVRRIHFYQFM